MREADLRNGSEKLLTYTVRFELLAPTSSWLRKTFFSPTGATDELQKNTFFFCDRRQISGILFDIPGLITGFPDDFSKKRKIVKIVNFGANYSNLKVPFGTSRFRPQKLHNRWVGLLNPVW